MSNIELPDKYPVDHQLIDDALGYVDGTDNHTRMATIGCYRSMIEIYNQTKHAKYWYDARHYERLLRGLILEGKLRRYQTLKGPYDG